MPPTAFGHPWLVRNWGMLGNDVAGCCVWSGAAHETVMLCSDARATIPTFTTKTVFADYGAVTGFNPNDESTDQGTDVQEAAAYRQKTGIIDILGNRHKIDIYTALRVGDVSELALTTYLNGATGVGVRLPSNAEDQFDRMEPWSVDPTASLTDGHYISCVGRNSLGHFLFVSWGRLQAATPQWVTEYMDEGIAFLSLERLRATGLSPQGFKQAELADDFKMVTRT